MILVHYNEIGLKGNNRHIFEEQLVENIKTAFGVGSFGSVRNVFVRVLIEGADENASHQRLQNVFGIAYFATAEESACNIAELKEKSWELAQKKKFGTFKVVARRADKALPFTSDDVNREVGEYVRQKSGAQVQMDRPDLTIYIEALSDKALLYTEKIPGPGGLQVGSSGKVLSLISSGIDSPVASWRIMKRGCTPVFVHFHSYQQTSKASLENVQEILKVLGGWSPAPLKFYAVP